MLSDGLPDEQLGYGCRQGCNGLPLRIRLSSASRAAVKRQGTQLAQLRCQGQSPASLQVVQRQQ